MSDCAKYIELISAYADGELRADEKVELEKHLETCEECRSILETYKLISLEIVEDIEEVPVGFAENVMEKVSAYEIKQKAKHKNMRIAGRWVGAAACIAIILFAFPRMPGLGCGSSVNDAAMETITTNSAADSGTTGAAPESDFVTMDSAVDTSFSDAEYPDSAEESMDDSFNGFGGMGSKEEGKLSREIGMYVTIYGVDIPEELLESEYTVTYYENGNIEYIVPVSFAKELILLFENAEVEVLDTEIDNMSARIIFTK